MKKIMKKLLVVSIAVISVMSFAGCGMKPASVPSENKVKVSAFKNTSGGIGAICKKLKDNQYVSDDCVKMMAGLIGAESGYRFDNVKVNGSVFSVEIYEFKNTDSDEAKSVIDSVTKDGAFEMFGRNVPYCYLSDNGKYLLVYPDAKSVSEKGDDIENAERLKKVLEVVNSVKN